LDSFLKFFHLDESLILKFPSESLCLNLMLFARSLIFQLSPYDLNESLYESPYESLYESLYESSYESLYEFPYESPYELDL